MSYRHTITHCCNRIIYIGTYYSLVEDKAVQRNIQLAMMEVSGIAWSMTQKHEPEDIGGHCRAIQDESTLVIAVNSVAMLMELTQVSMTSVQTNLLQDRLNRLLETLGVIHKEVMRQVLEAPMV
jgi:high-affinity nickel permease